jgi:GTPase
VLQEIGAAQVPQLLVFNKLDALENGRRPLQLADVFELDGKPVARIFVSSQSGEGLAALREQLSTLAKSALGAGMTPEHAAEFDPAAA